MRSQRPPRYRERNTRQQVRRSCFFKLSYETEGAAWIAVRRTVELPNRADKTDAFGLRPLQPYLCPFCLKWHLGHKPLAAMTKVERYVYWANQELDDARNIEWINDWAWRMWMKQNNLH